MKSTIHKQQEPSARIYLARMGSSASLSRPLLKSMILVTVAILLLHSLALTTSNGSGGLVEAKGGIHKRSFAGLGCLGIYDKAKFTRLDRVCEECYQLYREPDIHTSCRQDCFRNEVFSRCVTALLLTDEEKKLAEMVDELYGK